MKARLLKKILNDTEYCVNNNREYIAVGSPICHKLISVDKKTLQIKYALDTFHQGRESLRNPELVFIWDKLTELIASGEIKDIIEGDDVIETPLTVWTFEDGKLIETHTDKYGYPNTTFDGFIMYENTHFLIKQDAIKKGIREYQAAIEAFERMVAQNKKKLEECQEELAKYEKYLSHFNSLPS